MFQVREDDLSGEQTCHLLALHLAGMHSNSPPESVYALDLSRLRTPGITVWSVWEGQKVVGIGALKDLGGGGGEVKSMRTHPDHLRRGAAALLLSHIVAKARGRGWTQLSLETGTGPAFEPALSLYLHNGFVNREAFSDYRATTFNQFLHLTL